MIEIPHLKMFYTFCLKSDATILVLTKSLFFGDFDIPVPFLRNNSSALLIIPVFWKSFLVP